MIDNINIRGPILICFQPGIDILRNTCKYGLLGTGLVLGLSVSRVVWLLERGVTHVTTNVVSDHVRTNEPSLPSYDILLWIPYYGSQGHRLTFLSQPSL